MTPQSLCACACLCVRVSSPNQPLLHHSAGQKQQEMKSEVLFSLKSWSAQTLRGASCTNQQNQPTISNVLKPFIQGIMLLNALTVQWG